MSAEEMRSFCQSISPYQLRVQVRLKDQHEILFGRILSVELDRFRIMTDEKEIKDLRYAWVARIKNA